MRVLEEADFDVAGSLLAEGFPERGTGYWRLALRHLALHGGNREAHYPLGFLLLDRTEPVGVILTPAGLRTEPDGSRRRIVNLSSWTVREPFRWRAGFMLRSIFQQEGPARHDIDGALLPSTFTDLTPTPALQRMLPALGMQAVNRGVELRLLPMLCRSTPGARLHELAPQDRWNGAGPTASQLATHRELGCLLLVLEIAADAAGRARSLLLVLRPLTVRGVPAMQLVYCADRAALDRHIGALALHLLRRGRLVLVCDSRESASSGSALFRPRDVWWVRGEDFSNRTDVLGSELCVIHGPARQLQQLAA